MPNWLLPEYVEDILPIEAQAIERLRARLLELFRVHGYQLVVPPMLEYTDSLLTGTGRDLDLRTFKLVDQLSGRMMGVRADMTPQVARIDAHLLNRPGLNRLCYCGTVLHSRPRSLAVTREPMQIGAELFGHAGIESDIEIHQLLRAALAACDLQDWRLDLSHVGVFRAVVRHAALNAEQETALLEALVTKDRPAVQLQAQSFDARTREAVLNLLDMYGGVEVLARARQKLPDYPEIGAALDDLSALVAQNGLDIGIDLADLRGYHYHSGVVFSAYQQSLPSAIALGGRYDEVGKAFGRARPATGFSLDLRQLAQVSPRTAGPGAIIAPHLTDAALSARVAQLREAGEVVIDDLPGQNATRKELGCDRQLVFKNGTWEVVSC
jgi:ATP phosphoribosyltransferase regulatory subunit